MLIAVRSLGNDGAWSTFSIHVGNPPQPLQVIASTEQAATWAVAPAGCATSNASNCTDARGGAFDATKSSSWFRKDIFRLDEATNLGYDSPDINGTYGFDTLGVQGMSGAANISAEHQVLAGIITDKFYLGSLGLAPQAINFSESGDTSPSFLSSLKSNGTIPSLAYGYTAGASYKQNGINASLILGGYDTSRFTPNDVSFLFAPSPKRQLVVGLQSITYADSKGEQPLLSEGILALVDSTVPHLWLPASVCEVFESVFGISWDPLRQLYTLNDTVHDTLMETNPSVIFTLANSVAGGGPSVNITLPYASFDLQANVGLNRTSPLDKTETRYFPLQRGPDGDSYTLGRTFLQEAYMMVNYENSSFSVSQSKFDAATPSHILPITANDTGSSGSNPTSSAVVKTTGNDSHGIGTGAIAGLAIAIALVGIIAAITAFWCMRRRRRAKRSSQLSGGTTPGEDPAKVDDSKERDSSDDPGPKKVTVGVHATNTPITPPPSEMPGQDFFSAGTPMKPTELEGEHLSRSELSTPDPSTRPELASSDTLPLRSELSTPEPLWSNPELPTPDPSHELPSPSVSVPTQSHPSPNLDASRSALNSPVPLVFPGRPLSMRMDSSESESGFTYDNMRQFHRRFHTDASGLPTTKKQSQTLRTDADVSAESLVLGRSDSSSSHAETVSPTVSSPGSALPPAAAFKPVLQHSARPPPQRLGSADSETLETRLEMSTDDVSPPVSRFGTTSRREQPGSESAAIERKPMSATGSGKHSQT
ncbi:MAG: hypothetical protein Q9163_006192 [Psora crenata]